MDSSIRPRRFEARWMDGTVIDIRYRSTRIDKHTHVDWAIQVVASEVAWPVEYLSFAVGDRVFQYVHRITHRDGTLLIDLWNECHHAGHLNNDATALVISVIRHPPPDVFGQRCICDFPGHGCCINGRSDHLREQCQEFLQFQDRIHYGCLCCGNNGSCRCGDCGHECCKARRSSGQ